MIYKILKKIESLGNGSFVSIASGDGSGLAGKIAVKLADDGYKITLIVPNIQNKNKEQFENLKVRVIRGNLNYKNTYSKVITRKNNYKGVVLLLFNSIKRMNKWEKVIKSICIILKPEYLLLSQSQDIENILAIFKEIGYIEFEKDNNFYLLKWNR